MVHVLCVFVLDVHTCVYVCTRLCAPLHLYSSQVLPNAVHCSVYGSAKRLEDTQYGVMSIAV